MEVKYKIKKKGITLLNQLTYDSKDKVFSDIKNLDILPPFKVTDLITNKDVTNEILEYIEKKGYLFVDKEDIFKLLPEDLLTFISKDASELFLSYESNNVKLSNKFYIKSVIGFFELWKYKYIPFGYMGNFVIFIDTASINNPIYIIDHENVSEINSKKLLVDDYKVFLNKLESRKA